MAGRHRDLRLRVVQQAADALRENGFDVHAEATVCKGSATAQSRDAVQDGAQAIFACGGDGTVHEVLQGIAGSGALLGIVPAGSANALAQELGILRDPVQAARSFRPGAQRQVRTIIVHRRDAAPLYSACMAGAGPDGVLMYRMLTVDRAGIGRWRYYEHALRLMLSHRFSPFQVALQHENGRVSQHRVVSAMALRVGDLQGVFAGLARGASLWDEALHVVLVAPPARISLPLWFVLSWFGLHRFHPGLTIAKAVRLHSATAVPLQVDGEWAGHCEMTVTRDGPAQGLLVPATHAHRAR